MHILVLAPDAYYQNWKNAFEKYGKAHQLYFDLEEGLAIAEKIDVLLLWKHPQGLLNHFKNAQVFYSMGAGVDHILSDPSYDFQTPVCRVIDPYMADDMGNFLLMAVLNYHRRIPEIQANERQKYWDNSTLQNIPVRIGVMGMGHLGQAIAEKLHALKFPVVGYSNTAKTELKYRCYGAANMNQFLQEVNVIILLLPATPSTQGLLNREFFEKCHPGTYIINVARGPLVVIEDLIEAVDQGQLSGALLDVFPEEPLPKTSPLWTHPKIQVTPHIASITAPETAASQIFTNLEGFTLGNPLNYQVDLSRGY